MKKTLPLILLLLVSILSKSQTIPQKDWATIDKRPIPEWFEDAKFGIFIHWGIYSVPMWSPKGTYQEWYKYWLDNKTLFGNGDFSGTEIYDYHTQMYGEDFDYSRFAPMFKAMDYDAGQWAQLFQKSGAKYVVLTTKHHDGFALWPSKEASAGYGRPWNSMETGAKRDLVGEYVNALKKTDIKVGCYFSLREWGNPLYTPETMDLYLKRHHYPQLKDLVTRYEPDLIWADGPDQMDENTWKVKDFLTWLYSESPVKDKIVVNDRWAKWSDKFHGDYYTREYSNKNMPQDKPWEECRGMGFSFAYNQNEDLEDYASPQGLILTLINVVSKGGNLLLGIGPNGNGKIPPIMQERLLQMGKWLQINGEAIYGTRAWKRSEQWSEGDRNWKDKAKHYVGGDAILKQTVNPDSGYAVKEAFFTQKGNAVYAILPKYPKQQFIWKDVRATSETKISMLGLNEDIKWEQRGNNLVVTLPKLSFDEVPCLYAWTLKAEHIK